MGKDLDIMEDEGKGKLVWDGFGVFLGIDVD
jgi:hypothetical protein